MQIDRAVNYRRCCPSQGLGFIDSLLSTAGALFGGSGGSGGGSGGQMPITVSPQISTQISPSISPVFQQQFQPTNSAATAGTASAPAFGAPGADGGYAPVPVLPQVPGMLPVSANGQPLVSAPGQLPKWLPLAILGAGVGAYFLLRKR